MAELEGPSEKVADGMVEIGGDEGLPYFDVGDVDYSNLLQVEINSMPLCVHLDNKSFAEVAQEVVDILADRLIERDEENRPTGWFGVKGLRAFREDDTPITAEEQAEDDANRKIAEEREKSRFERDKKLADGAREWRESQKTKPAT